jgi:hypothetical protein
MASFTIRSIQLDVLSKIMVLLKSMQCCVDTVLRHHRLIRLIEMDVSPMFLALVSTDLPFGPRIPCHIRMEFGTHQGHSNLSRP